MVLTKFHLRVLIFAIFAVYFRIRNKIGGGTGGRETGRKGGGRCTGGGRRGGGKRDSQGGGKREKRGKITQHCAIFRNRKNAKGREPKNTGREPGLKGTGSGRFKPPCPPPLKCYRKHFLCNNLLHCRNRIQMSAFRCNVKSFWSPFT